MQAACEQAIGSFLWQAREELMLAGPRETLRALLVQAARYCQAAPSLWWKSSVVLALQALQVRGGLAKELGGGGRIGKAHRLRA